MVGMQSCYAVNSQVSELPSLSGTLNVNTANMETHLLSHLSLQADFRVIPSLWHFLRFFPCCKGFFFQYGKFFITRTEGLRTDNVVH